MKRGSISHFITRTLIAALPLAMLVVTYLLTDPFRVIRHYDDGTGARSDTVRFSVNAGWVAITNFERYQPTYRYDSFIFGSSMSQNFSVAHWQQYLPEGSRAYHMDQSMETIEGMTDKLRWLLSRGDTVRHALIIIEQEMLLREPIDDDFLFARPPQTLTLPFATVRFHITAFNSFKDPDFLSWRFTDGDIRSAWGLRFATTDIQDRIKECNESYYARFDSLIAVDPEEYYTPERLRRIDVTVEPTPERPAIDRHRLDRLLSLRDMLHRHHSDYNIIIVPRFKRTMLHPSDRAVLIALFGAGRVHDFSHDTVLADNPHYYYDHAAHPTSATCRLLLDLTYQAIAE